MKRDLAGAVPTPMEKLLAQRITACWLAAQFADMALADGAGTDGPRVAQIRAKQAESASRRMLAAMKTLAVVRRLAHGLRIEIAHSQAPAIGRAPVDTSIADRMHGLIREEMAVGV